jgi:hypothetical protein
MRLGVTMPRDNFVTTARLVERLGFDSFWTFDAIGRGFIRTGRPAASARS